MVHHVLGKSLPCDYNLKITIGYKVVVKLESILCGVTPPAVGSACWISSPTRLLVFHSVSWTMRHRAGGCGLVCYVSNSQSNTVCYITSCTELNNECLLCCMEGTTCRPADGFNPLPNGSPCSLGTCSNVRPWIVLYTIQMLKHSSDHMTGHIWSHDWAHLITWLVTFDHVTGHIWSHDWSHLVTWLITFGHMTWLHDCTIITGYLYWASRTGYHIQNMDSDHHTGREYPPWVEE